MANPAQWMREAAEEWCEERDTDTTRLLAELIARHAPSEDWIKVSERLPDKEMRCLVLRSNAHPRIDVEWFCRVSDPWSRGFYDDGEQDTNVTHWRPLPAPPRV